MIVVCLFLTAAAGMLFANGEQEVVMGEGANGGYSFEIGEMTVEYTIAEEQIEITLAAPTEGWIAIGFEPSSVMKDANIIIGAVENGTLTVEDHFGTSTFVHKPDTDIGGSRDVTGMSGSEADGSTTLSFSIPLDSGDSYDTVLHSGDSVKVILAYANKDAFRTKHSYRTSAEITLE